MRTIRDSAEWRFLAALRVAAPGLSLLWWLVTVLRGLLPAMFALLMGQVVSNIESGSEVGGAIFAIGLVFVVMQAAGPLHDLVSTEVGERVTTWLHEKLVLACVRPDGVAHLESPELADELATARDFDRGITGPDIITSMPNVGGGFARFLGGLAQVAILFAYRWWAPVLIGGAWLSTHHFLKKGAVWHSRTDPEMQTMQRRADYAYRLAVQPPAAKEVRLFGLADWLVGGFVELRTALLDASWEARRLGWKSVRWALLLVVAANAAFFWQLARDATDGAIAVGAVVVFAQAAVGASALAFAEWDWWFRTAAQPVPVVLDLAARMAPVASIPTGAATVESAPSTAIQFDDVSFRYPGTDDMVLDGLSLDIPAGTSLAIVGKNGAGKTTLAKLLCRLYDPTEGAVRIDGTDLRALDVESWRAQLAPVFQDFVRWELPLRDNVAPGADDALVRRALVAAAAGEVGSPNTILSKGYDGGTDLSGGQWQRVAIARALAAVERGAGVVLLDEPTAHLDVRAELAVFERVLDATVGRTTILVSHRFATVRRADRIAVVEGGRVIEYGTHDELLELDGRYATMYRLQAARFDDAVPAEEEQP